MVFLDKYGWPIERIKGHHFSNLLRTIIHTRKIVKTWEQTAHTEEEGSKSLKAPQKT